jgi:hypothetical protein
VPRRICNRPQAVNAALTWAGVAFLPCRRLIAVL